MYGHVSLLDFAFWHEILMGQFVAWRGLSSRRTIFFRGSSGGPNGRGSDIEVFMLGLSCVRGHRNL